MNKNLIGLNAGKVWQLLNNNKRWSYSELKEAVGLSDRDLNAAIGWLAREDKIDFEKLRTDLDAVGEATATKIHVMHEDIFNSMHRI